MSKKYKLANKAQKKRKKKMDDVKVEPVLEVVKERTVDNSQMTMQIFRGQDPQTLSIYVRAPILASVVRNMTPSNYDKAAYAEIYKPILRELPANKLKVITRSAISKATRNFVPGTDFSFSENPRAILLANPEALEEGYTLQFKVDVPVAQEQLRKWGKLFIEGCMDIISNARPFRMSWVMNKE